MQVRYIRKILLGIVAFVLAFPWGTVEVLAQTEPEVETRIKGILTIEGKQFRDLNDNGQLDLYENWQLSTDERVNDLLEKMTLEEKVGLLTINEFPQVQNGKLVFPNQFLNQHTRYFIYRGMVSADQIADQMNQLQQAAEGTRLGIPAVVISNPRNHVSTIPNIDEPGQFSHWPDPLGFAASRDSRLARRFGEIAAKEWRAAGIHKMYGYPLI